MTDKRVAPVVPRWVPKWSYDEETGATPRLDDEDGYRVAWFDSEDDRDLVLELFAEVEALRAMVRRLVDAVDGYVWTSPDMADALDAANALVPPVRDCECCGGTGKPTPPMPWPYCGCCMGSGITPGHPDYPGDSD